MSITYCGKDCAACTAREALHCAQNCACGFPPAGDCPVADCCREKGIANCTSCLSFHTCYKRSRIDTVPQERLERRQQAEARRAALAGMAGALAKWLWVLFWLSIAAQIVNTLSGDELGGLLPWMNRPLQLVGLAISLGYIAALSRLGRCEDGYRIAMWCMLGTVAVDAGALLLAAAAGRPAEAILLLFAVPSVILNAYAKYRIFLAHSAVLTGLNDALAEKWPRLWRWLLLSLGGLVVSVLLSALIPVLGLLALLAVLVAVLVCAVLEYVYLYQTAQAFRHFPAE